MKIQCQNGRKALSALKKYKKSVLLLADDLSEPLSADQGLESKREESFRLLNARLCMDPGMGILAFI